MTLSNRHRLADLSGCSVLTFAQQVDVLTICQDEQRNFSQQYGALRGYAQTQTDAVQAQAPVILLPYLERLDAMQLAELCQRARHVSRPMNPFMTPAQWHEYAQDHQDVYQAATGLRAYRAVEDVRQRVPDIDDQVQSLAADRARLRELKELQGEYLHSLKSYDVRVLDLGVRYQQEAKAYVEQGAPMPARPGVFSGWLRGDQRTPFEKDRDELLHKVPELRTQLIGYVTEQKEFDLVNKTCAKLNQTVQAQAPLCDDYVAQVRAAITPQQVLWPLVNVLALNLQPLADLPQEKRQPVEAQQLAGLHKEQAYFSKAGQQLAGWSKALLRGDERVTQALTIAAVQPDQAPLAYPVAADVRVLLSWLQAHDSALEANQRHIAQRQPLVSPPSGLPLPPAPAGEERTHERSLYDDLCQRMRVRYPFDDRDLDLGRERERGYSYGR